MLEILKEITINAGRILREGYDRSNIVEFKNTIDLVTEYDKKTEEFIIDQISKHFPGIPVISEELQPTSHHHLNCCFYVDPIDGTTNFVHRFPFCAVSIGFFSESTKVGIVYNPIIGELFHAVKSEGAYLNGNKISVSQESMLINSLIATGFPYSIIKENKKHLIEMLERVLKNTRGIRRAGSASLDLCYVAKGVFQGYYESDLKPWDVAAGTIILEEAGGTVTGLNGNIYDIWSDFIVASNKHIHKDLLRLLNGK
ncbi:MAG: inositol monophosphatase [Calditerrivibrio sp.]|nr:inositol monophosphatase [Calditerrivibrio sp.]